jgi:hypothetical protein
MLSHQTDPKVSGDITYLQSITMLYKYQKREELQYITPKLRDLTYIVHRVPYTTYFTENPVCFYYKNRFFVPSTYFIEITVSFMNTSHGERIFLEKMGKTKNAVVIAY